MKKKIHRKYSLINIPIRFRRGDVIHFVMPPFYSGEYTAKVLLDPYYGLYILESHNYFDGCRDFVIERNGKIVAPTLLIK